MSKSNTFINKISLTLYVIILSILLIGAGIGLTLYLINTIETPFSKKQEPESGTDLKSILSLTEQVVVRHQGEWTFSEPKIKGHFHHIGRWYERDTWNFCIDCHGPIPHSNSAQIRAFLNMHTLYTSCLVCHVREYEEKEPTRFGWIGLDNGELTDVPAMNNGVWGEYGAKISQLVDDTGIHKPLHLNDQRELAHEFKKDSNKMSETQKTIAVNIIHNRCLEEPVRCTRCHTPEKTFLPYKVLGYSNVRIEFLVKPEVVDLVQRYETFFMPSLLDIETTNPDEAGKDE